MKVISILLIILQAAVIKSLAGHCDLNDCQFTYDASSLMDDSDYQVDGSGSDSYTIGDDLRLRVHVSNDWELEVSWSASRYRILKPYDGWNYKVQVDVNTTYQTPFGEKVFTSRSEKITCDNHERFPLYNPSATYTITVLAATRTTQCLGERMVVSDLPGRLDAVAHFQMRLKFYSYWPCEKKLNNKHSRVLSQFRTEMFDALSQERFQQHYGVSLNVSQYQLADLKVACEKDDVAIFTGRVVAMGNTSNTRFIKAMQSWVKTQPVLPFRYDSVVVDHTCPVYYVPDSEEYCTNPKPDMTTTINSKSDETSSDNSSDNTVIIVVITIVAVILLIIVSVGLGLLVRHVYKRRNFLRITNLSFRSRANIARCLRINNMLADIESIGHRSPDVDSNTSSEPLQSSSHQQSKGT